jgi:ribosomal protein S12 methylthiotransferase accessory factor YcaO
VNLAGFRYRNILSSHGGPIGALSAHPTSDGTFFLAFAALEKFVRPDWMDKLAVYGPNDGTGTSKYKTTAAHKAISEALERWAFYAVARSENAALFGFDIDCSTSGMAAFPAFTSKPARKNALIEAIERWSVCAWWEGYLKSESSLFADGGIEVLRIEPLWMGIETVILQRRSRSTGARVFAFSSGRSLATAIARASVELERNSLALDRFYQRFRFNSDSGVVNCFPELQDTYEKRLVFFSTLEGYKAFQRRTRSSPKELIRVPTLLIDAEIKGPWSRFASVWRCMFSPVSDQAFGIQSDYFLF